jgi:catechol 2,3-dioxygenase-like lactoylglutathione lyase family enzyme
MTARSDENVIAASPFRHLTRRKVIATEAHTAYDWRIEMLVDHSAVATLPVRELGKAEQFYEGTLGLKHVGPEEPGVRVYEAGGSKIFVYESKYAGTNQATAVTWSVGDEFDAVMRTLKAKGVVFEHYDLPNMKLEGDVHVSGRMRAAWFKDPDGNINSLVNE